MVIATIGILAAIALPSYQAYVYRAKAAEIVTLIDKIHTVLATLQSEQGATLGNPLRVSTNLTGGDGDPALVYCIRSLNCGKDTQPVAGLSMAELSLPHLGIFLGVGAGNGPSVQQPGQYRIGLNVEYRGHVSQQLRAEARQIILATHHVMKSATYKDTIARDGSVNLYFQLGGK